MSDKLPIADDNLDQEAVDAIKGRLRAIKDRALMMKNASKILMRAKAERAKGLVHFTEDDEPLETAEAVMAYELSGHKAVAKEPPKEPEPILMKGTASQEDGGES